MALRDTVQTIKKFAEDTNFIAAAITNNSQFYRDDDCHDRVLRMMASYSKTNTQELIDAIFDGVDDTHKLQLVFDIWKQQLNTINVPNYGDGQFIKKFGGLQHFKEAEEIREDILEICGSLRREIGYFVQEYQLVDNNPKIGFLCPLYYEYDEVTTEQETSQQEAIKQPQQPTGIVIPDSLQDYKDQLFTDRANKYFPIALANGLIEQTSQGYKKHSGISKALLAYFLQRVYIVDGAVFPEKALDQLFGESYLKQAVYVFSGNKNADGKPRQYQKVDAIFDEA